MRKPDFAYVKNKGADQLRCNLTANQRLCCHYIDSTVPLLSDFKPQATFRGCAAPFVSDLVGNPEDRFSPDAAHMILNFISLILSYCH